MKRKIKDLLFWVKIFLGLFIVTFLLWSCDFDSVVAVISSIHIAELFPALFLYVCTILLLSFRWRFILKNMGYNVSMRVTFQAFSAGILLSDISPGRIGEISRPFFIRDLVPFGLGCGSFFLDRYIDFIGKGLLCGIALFFFIALFPPQIICLFLGVSLVPVFILTFLWISGEKTLDILSRTGLSRIHAIGGEVHSGLKQLRRPYVVLIISLILTLITAIMQGIRLVILAGIMGYHIPIAEVTILQSLISSLALVPITISGLGLVEGGLTTMFAYYGVPSAIGLSIAILDRMITICVHLIGGLWYIVKK